MTATHPLTLAQQAALRSAGRDQIDRPLVAWEVADLDLDQVRARFEQLAQAHSILRATVGGRGRRAKLEIADAVAGDLVFEERLDDAADLDRLSELLSVTAEPAAQPLVRVGVIRTPDGSLLALSGSPLIVDDAALDALAAALLDGVEPADYLADSDRTAALAQWSTGTPSTEFWAARLAEAPEATEIGGDRARFVRSVTTERWSAVTEAVGGHDDAAVLAALVASSLVAGGHAADVVIGVGIADHDQPTLGPDINYLPLRLQVADTDTPATLSARAHTALQELTAHADVRGEWLHHRHGADGRLFDAVIVVEADARSGLRHRIPVRPESAGRVVRLELSGADGVLSVDTGTGASGDLPGAERLASSLIKRGTRWIATPTLALSDIAAAAADEGKSDADGWPVPRTESATGPSGGDLTTERELILAEAIRDVLSLSADASIGREDTFFTLGGDSVGALKVVTAVGERGYAIDVESVFTHPEIGEIAARMTEGAPEPAAEPQAVQALSASGLDPAALAALSGEFASTTEPGAR